MRLIVRTRGLHAENLLTADLTLKIFKGKTTRKAACRNQRRCRSLAVFRPEVNLAHALALAPEVEASRQLGEIHRQRFPLRTDPRLIVQNKAVVGQHGIGVKRQGIEAVFFRIGLDRSNCILGEGEMRLIVRARGLHCKDLLTAGLALEVLKGKCARKVACRKQRLCRCFSKFKPEVNLAHALALAPEPEVNCQIGKLDIGYVPLLQTRPLFTDDETVVVLDGVGMDSQQIKAVLRGVAPDGLKPRLRESEIGLIVPALDLHAVDGRLTDRAHKVPGRDIAADPLEERRCNGACRFGDVQLFPCEPQIDLGRALTLAPESEALVQLVDFDLRCVPCGRFGVGLSDDESVVVQKRIGVNVQEIIAVLCGVGFDPLKTGGGEFEIRLIVYRLKLHAVKRNAVHLALEIRSADVAVNALEEARVDRPQLFRNVQPVHVKPEVDLGRALALAPELKLG